VVFKRQANGDWTAVWNIKQLGTFPAGDCLAAINFIQPEGEVQSVFEAWDIKIGHNTSTPTVIMVGGIGSSCGAAFVSHDEGATWTREFHECDCASLQGQCTDCTGPDYNSNGQGNHLYHLRELETLYNVGVFSDNTAIACGYSGQQVRRNLTSATSGIWQDKSEYGDFTATSAAVIVPLEGAAVSTTGSIGWMTGFGGYIRRTTDGGTSWSTETFGAPWRVRDVYFTDDMHGWQVGQFYRLASTSTWGISWDEAAPHPDIAKPGCLDSIAFANGSASVGVAVGEADHSQSPYPFTGRPA
jgi:hypothetical protein